MNKKAQKIIMGILGATAMAATGLALVRIDSPSLAKGWDEEVLPGEESLFAEIDRSGNVLRVIVVDAEVVNSGLFGDPSNWVRTYAYKKEVIKRGKHAGKGDKYDKKLDIFIEK